MGNKVQSNAVVQESATIDAIIVYPSLGAPTFVDKEGFFHLVVLGPDGNDPAKKLTPAIVNRRLRLVASPNILMQWKRGKYSGRPPEPLYKDDQTAATNIPTIRIISAEEPFEIPELSLKGLWATKVFDLYQKGTHHNNEGKFKKQQELDSEKYKTLYHIKISLVNSPWYQSQQWEPEDNFLDRLAAAFTIPSRYYLYWFGNDIGWPNAWPPKKMENSQSLFRRLLLNSEFIHTDGAKTKLFLGERLVKKLDKNGKYLGTIAFGTGSFQSDYDIVLTDIHPVYLLESERNHFNIGFISDLHHVTKFQILRNSTITAIPGDKTVPAVGNLVLDTVKTLEEHFINMVIDPLVDVIVVGGDLVDFHQDNFPTDTNGNLLNSVISGKVKKHKTIWDACTIESNQEKRKKNYQSGVSVVGLYRKIVEIVLNCDKPVIMIGGNHDGYHEPFGISPRIDTDIASSTSKADSSELKLANEGIPADCNLTIQEACLAFGPSYGWFSEIADFESSVMEMFYLLYTPFRTWTFRLGCLQQLLVLDWGDSEDMFFNQDTGLGHLPHADKAYSERDLSIANYAVAFAEQGKGVRVTALAHATFACYSPDIPIHPNGNSNEHEFPRKSSEETPEERRQREFENIRSSNSFGYSGIQKLPDVADTTTYNYGTFSQNRPEFFALLEKPNHTGISFCLSGHAHRAAGYQIVSAPGSTKVRVKGFHFDEMTQLLETNKLSKSKCIIAVSDSAGPIPRDNRADGFLGWGSRPSAWTRVVYGSDGLVETLDSIPVVSEKTKPRLAVALDYLETSVVVKAMGLLPDDFDTIEVTNDTRFWEITSWFDGESHLPEKYRRIWKVNGQKVGLNKGKYVVHAGNRLDDIFYSIATSCSVSERIQKELLKENPLLFHFNEGALPLPEGVGFQKMILQGTVLCGKTTVKFVDFPLNYQEKGKWAWNVQGDLAEKLSVPTENNGFGSGWIKIYFSGSSSIYDVSTPWVVKVFIVFQAEEAGNRFLIIRDSLAMERPNHKNYQN